MFSIHFAQTERERQEIYRLRYEVYIDEMRKPYPDADHEARMLRDALDDTAVLLVCRGAGRVVGTVRSLMLRDAMASPELVARLALDRFAGPVRRHVNLCSRLVIAQGHRGGRALLAVLLGIYQWGLANDVHVSLCDTRASHVDLFHRLGYRDDGPPFVDEAAGAIQYPLSLQLRDLAYLRAVKSPFARALEQHLEMPPDMTTVRGRTRSLEGVQP
jgi:predicted GNAT family N-acyltransferase